MSLNYENIKNNRLIRKCYYGFRGLTKKQELSARASATLDEFGVTFGSEAEREARIADMVRMNRQYGFKFDEYIFFRFPEKSDKERLEFVADWEHLGYTNALNDTRNAQLFDNKFRTYGRFRKYYKRQMLLFENAAQSEEFGSFVRAHDEFIIKPLNLSCGRGVQICCAAEIADAKETYAQLLKETGGRFVAEELIRQVEELKKLHPSSVNTMRVITIRLDRETVIVHPQLRIGRHGNTVDNAGAGGIKGAVDPETGVIIATGDNHGDTFTVHPDTGEQILGFRVPRWEELKALVRELASVVPENRYTGWDMALTEDGWVLVEANRRAQFGFQVTLQQGFRREIDGYLKELGKKY